MLIRRLRTRSLLVLATLLCLSAFAVSVTAAEPTDTERARAAEQRFIEHLDALVEPLIKNEVVVGMTVGVIGPNGKALIRGYGKTGADGGKPDGKTVYEIGSITKGLTGVLLADAEARGVLKISDPMRLYLPNTARVPGDHEPITLEHLATHTSGLPRLPTNLRFVDRLDPYAAYTVKEMYAYLGGAKLATRPGEKHAYSNLGQGLLGHILGLAQGKSYEDLVIERITKPLGMSDTRLILTDDMKKRFATPHSGPQSPVKPWAIPTLAGAGGLRSTAEDMLKFGRAMLQTRDAKTMNAAPANQRALIAAMDVARKPRVKMDPKSKRPLRVGLGWMLARDGVTTWHNGQTGGFHCYFAASPKLGVTVILLANTSTGKVSQLGDQVVMLAAGAMPKPLVLQKSKKLDVKVLDRYVGTYAMIGNAQLRFTVTRKDDSLHVQLTGQPALPIYAKSETRFFYRAVAAEIEFGMLDKKSGKARRLTLFQNGRTIPARRITAKP